MDIRLIYREVPDAASCAALDRKFKNVSSVQESICGGRRLWLSHMPETVYRPFAKARPFDILVGGTRLSDGESEEFRMGMGAIPKRCLICRSHSKDSDGTCEQTVDARRDCEENAVVDVLFALALEIMTTTSALLCLDNAILKRMFGFDSRWPTDDDMWKAKISQYPGQIAEIAHECADGELWIEWIVDARWLRAWIDVRNRRRGDVSREEFSRFSSLDYATS